MPRIEPRQSPKGIRIGPTNTSFGREVILVNPSDASWTKHRYVFALGTYGWTRVMVWANGYGDAVEHVGEWCLEHAPGFIVDDEVEEAYRAGIEDGLDEEAAQQQAEEDTTSIDGGHYLTHEHTLALEDPTREELEFYLWPLHAGWGKERERCEAHEDCLRNLNLSRACFALTNSTQRAS